MNYVLFYRASCLTCFPRFTYLLDNTLCRTRPFSFIYYVLFLCCQFVSIVCLGLNKLLDINQILQHEWIFFIDTNFFRRYLVNSAMVKVACPRVECDYETEDLEPVIVAALLQVHATSHTSAGNAIVSRGPKLDRPKIDAGVNQETWNMFLKRWEAFRTCSGISDSMAAVQLLQCASVELSERLFKADNQLTKRSACEVLKAMQSMAVIPVARGIVRDELKKMRQANDESFRAFAARVRGKAETCSFELQATCPCPCKKQFTIDYTVEEIRDVLLAGIGCAEIKQEALIADQVEEKTINEIVAFVEKREMARSAVAGARNQSAAFTFNRSKQPASTSTHRQGGVSNQSDAFSKRNTSFKQETSRADFIACPMCNEKFRPFKRLRNGKWNKNPFKECLSCWRSLRQSSSGVQNVHLENAECAISQTSLAWDESARPQSRSESGNANLS